jgi:uncharacterized membrane protein YgcG
MTAKLTAQVAFLAVLGIVVAAGIGLLTNAIAGDSVGLSASPLRAGNLAPPQVKSKPRGDNRHDRREQRREDLHKDDSATSTTTTTSAPTTTTTAPPPAITTTSSSGELELGDDHGGSSNSGSGSSSSGSGSSGGGLDD